jgi:ATP-binding cassette subfamily C protein
LGSSLAGGLSLASLLPLFSLATDASQASDSLVAQTVLQILAVFGQGREIAPLLMVLVAAFAVKNLLTLLGMLYVGNTAAKVQTELRSDLIKRLLSVRWNYLASQPMGRFTNVMSVDAMRAGKAYLAAANFFSNVLQALVYVAIAFFVSLKLSLLALVIGLTIALSLQVFVRISRRAGMRQTNRTRELVTYFTDALNNIKPLKAMARQDGFERLFDKKIRSLRKALRRQVLSKEVRRALEQTLTILCVAVLFYAAVAIWAYEIPEVLVMGVLLLQTLGNIGKVQEYLQETAVLESPFRAVQDVIEEAEQAREPIGDGKAPSLERGVRLDAVDFTFGETRVLDGIDLDLPRGMLTVLTGPSGAGKTTIGDLLLGLYEPSAGEVLVDDVPLKELDRTAWRRMIGYVPQELILFHDTIYANVSLGEEAITEAAAQAALEAAGAWDFVRAHPDGMMAVVGEKGAKLSGGQRQRIALARALATRPRLLILDEVTSALDPDTEKDLCRRLRDLTKDMAVLAITHRLSILDIADRIHRLEEGTLTEVVTPAAASLARPA